MKSPRFSLRALILIIAVFGICLGYRADRARHQRAAVKILRDSGAEVLYDYQVDWGSPTRRGYQPLADAVPSEPAWLDNLAGVDFFHDPVYVNFFDKTATAHDIAQLKSFPRLKYLCLQYMQATSADLEPIYDLTDLRCLVLSAATVDDDAVARIAQLRNLECLYLGDTRITDRTVKQLAAINNLWFLDLENTATTDESVESLASLSKLEKLVLYGTEITDASVPALSQFKNLQGLWISHTKITAPGFEQLKTALPNINIDWHPFDWNPSNANP